MGSELVSPASPISYTEQFEQVCPFYISIGMSYDEFWNGSADRAVYYRKAYLMQQRRNNDLAWLNGRYVFDAIMAAAPAFKPSAGKNGDPPKYLKEPYPFTKEDCEERQRRDMEEKAKRFREYVNARNAEQRSRQEVKEDANDNRPITD